MESGERTTRHSAKQREAVGSIFVDDNGLFWNGKFWPNESKDEISRRMGQVKSSSRLTVADSGKEIEVFWFEETQKDIWSIVYQKNMDQVDQTLAIDENLANLRQNHELGRLKTFVFDDTLPKGLLDKRSKCEQRRRNIGNLMESIIQRSIRVREKRRSFVVNTQEDDLIGILIVNPLHEKTERVTMATLSEEGEENQPFLGATVATLNRKKREKEKKQRPVTVLAPSMPNLLNELHFFTDEVVDSCQVLETLNVDDVVMNTMTGAVANILIFSRNLVIIGENLILGNTGLPPQEEEKQKEIIRVGQELQAMVEKLLQITKKAVSTQATFSNAQKNKSSSEEKIERLKKLTENSFNNIKTTSTLVHSCTEEFTGVALTVDQ